MDGKGPVIALLSKISVEISVDSNSNVARWRWTSSASMLQFLPVKKQVLHGYGPWSYIRSPPGVAGGKGLKTVCKDQLGADNRMGTWERMNI